MKIYLNGSGPGVNGSGLEQTQTQNPIGFLPQSAQQQQQRMLLLPPPARARRPRASTAGLRPPAARPRRRRRRCSGAQDRRGSRAHPSEREGEEKEVGAGAPHLRPRLAGTPPARCAAGAGRRARPCAAIARRRCPAPLRHHPGAAGVHHARERERNGALLGSGFRGVIRERERVN